MRTVIKCSHTHTHTHTRATRAQTRTHTHAHTHTHTNTCYICFICDLFNQFHIHSYSRSFTLSTLSFCATPSSSFFFLLGLFTCWDYTPVGTIHLLGLYLHHSPVPRGKSLLQHRYEELTASRSAHSPVVTRQSAGLTRSTQQSGCQNGEGPVVVSLFVGLV